jgi:hypothetical protein
VTIKNLSCWGVFFRRGTKVGFGPAGLPKAYLG